MKKGLRYFLGCATIAVSSIFVAGCGEPQISNVTIDCDDVQFRIELNDDPLSASMLTAQMKKNIFDSLNASVQLSNGQSEKLEWNDNVVITIDSTETKQWGKDTGVFKFKLQYNDKVINFYVQVDAVTVGIDASQSQNMRFENVLDRGGDRAALESLINVSLKQKTGYNDDGTDKIETAVLPRESRGNLSFDWVTEQNVDIDAMPAEGAIGIGTYQCKVTYTVPGTDIRFESENIRVAVGQSKPAIVSSGTDSGYGKIFNAQIQQSEQNGNGVVDVTLSGNISYEVATQTWNGVEINEPAGNIVVLKFTAPAGFRKPNCTGARLVTYSGDGIVAMESAVGVVETDFITSEDNQTASFYKILRFDTNETCYQFDILWNENDVSRTYRVFLGQDAVLEEPEVLELSAAWANTDNLFEGAYKLDFNFEPTTQYVNSLAEFISLVDTTEDGSVAHTTDILDKFNFAITSDVDRTKPGVYENGLRISRKDAAGNILTGPKNVAYLDVYVCEPSFGATYVATEYYTLTQTVRQVVEDNACNIFVGGDFVYYDYPDESLGLEEGYLLGAKIEAPSNVEVVANDVQMTAYVSFDGGAHFFEEPDIIPTLQFEEDDAQTPFVNFFVSGQNEKCVGKIVIKWNGDVAGQTYVLKFDETAIFEFGKVQINEDSEIYTTYYQNASDSTYGEQIKNNFSITGVVPLTGNTNTVPVTIQAPRGVLKNDNAVYTIYKLSAEGKNWVRQNFTDETFAAIASVALTARVDETDNTSALIWEQFAAQASVLDGVAEGQAFLNVALDFSTEEIYRVVINWTGEEGADVEYNIDTRFADVYVGQVNTMDAKFSVDNTLTTSLNIPFGTTVNSIEQIMRESLVVSISTDQRTITTQNYAITLADNQTFDGFTIGATYVFDITYPRENGTLSEQVSVVVSTPDIVSQVMLNNNSTYDFDVTEQQSTSAIFDVDGVVQKVEGNYVVEFKIFDALSIGQSNYSTNNPYLVLKYKTLSNGSDILDRTTWTFVDDQVYTNQQSKAMLTQQVYAIRDGQEVMGYAFNIQKVIAQNIDNVLKPFAIEVVWSETFTQTFIIDPMAATLQRCLTEIEIDNFTANSMNGDSNLTVTKTASATYNITGVLAADDLQSEQLSHRLMLKFVTPEGFVLDSESAAYFWFGNNSEEKTLVPVVINENKVAVEFDGSVISQAGTIHLQIKWSAAYFDVEYAFDISNMQYATFATTQALNTTGVYPTVVTTDENSTQTQLQTTVLTNLQKAGVDRSFAAQKISGSVDILALSADTHVVKYKLTADILHNDNVKIGVSYNDGTEFKYVPEGENISHEDYRIWYNASTFLTSTAGQNAVLEFMLPFNLVEADAFYEIEVVWGNNVMPCLAEVRLDENCLFMTSEGTVTANPGTVETRGANTIVTAATNGFNITCIDAATNQPIYGYFNNYVLSGVAKFGSMAEFDLDNSFIAGIVISKPNDIVDASNASIKVLLKQTSFQTTSFLEIENYQNIQITNDGKYLVLFGIQDLNSELVVQINWNPESRYAAEYYHFTLSDQIVFDLDNTTEVESASIYQQQIEYAQDGKDVTISGNITYAENDRDLGNGYFVSAKFAIPEIENAFFEISGQDASVTLLKKNGLNTYAEVEAGDYVITKQEGYFEIAFKIGSIADQFRVVVNWNPTALLADEVYNIAFANNTQLVLVGTDVGVYNVSGQYGGNEAATLTQTTATLYGDSSPSVVYEVGGLISWTQANNDFGITSEGYVVGFTLSAPTGFNVNSANVSASYQRSQYVTSRFGDMIDIDKTTDAFAKFNDNQITLFFRVTDISDAFKICVSWDGVSTETIYIGISENLEFEINTDLTISAAKTFSGNTTVVDSTITVADGHILTVNGILLLRATDGHTSQIVNNGTITFGTNGMIVVGEGCTFVNNGKLVNFSEGRIAQQNIEQTNAITGVAAMNDSIRAEAFSSLKNAILQTADGGTITLLQNVTQSFEITAADVTTEKSITITSPEVVGIGQEMDNKTICPFTINNTNLKIAFARIDFVTDNQHTYNITTKILGKMVEINGENEFVTQLSFQDCTATTGMLILSENLTVVDRNVIPYMTSENFEGVVFENGTILSVYDSSSQKYTMDVINTFDALKQNYTDDAVIVFANSIADVTGKQKLLGDDQTFACNEESLLLEASQATQIEINCNLFGAITRHGIVIATENVTITNANDIFDCYILEEDDTVYFADIEDAQSYAIQKGSTQIIIVDTFALTAETTFVNGIEYIVPSVTVTGAVTLPANTVLHIANNGTLTLNEGATLHIAAAENIVYGEGATKQGSGHVVLTVNSVESVSSFASGYLYEIESCNISGAVTVQNDVVLKVVGTLILQNGTLTIPYANLIVANGSTITGTSNLTVVMPTNFELDDSAYFVGGATYNITNANVTTNFEMDEDTVFDISGNFVVANDCVFTIASMNHFIVENGATLSGAINYVETATATLDTYSYISGISYTFGNANISGNITVPVNTTYKITGTLNVLEDAQITANGTLDLSKATINVHTGKTLTITQGNLGAVIVSNQTTVANDSAGNIVFNLTDTTLPQALIGATYNFDSLVLGSLQLPDGTPVPSNVEEMEIGVVKAGVTINANSVTVINKTRIDGYLKTAQLSFEDRNEQTYSNELLLNVYGTIEFTANNNITGGMLKVYGNMVLSNGATITGNYVQATTTATELSTFAFTSGETYIFSNAKLSGNLTIAADVNVELISAFEVLDNCAITLNGALKFLDVSIDIAQNKVLTINQNAGSVLFANDADMGVGGGIVVNGATNLDNLISGATYNFNSLTITESNFGTAGVNVVVAGTLTVTGNATLSGNFVANDVAISNGATLTIAQGSTLELSAVAGATVANGAIVVDGVFKAENGLTITTPATLTISGTGSLYVNKTGNSGAFTLEFDNELGSGAFICFEDGGNQEYTNVTQTGQYNFSTAYDELFDNGDPE